MIKINLLPFRATRIKEKIKLHVFIYIGFSSILILAMTWFYIDYTTKLKDLRRRKDKLKEELISYKDITAKIRVLEQTKKRLTVN